MDEEAIAAKQRDNIPAPVEQKAPAPVAAQEGLASDFTGEFKLDEMTQYKLHEFFGEQYRSSDEESKQRASYIYETVAHLIGTSEYGYVISKMRDLEQMIGAGNSEQRLYKLYQWLKLDNARKKIDSEMGALYE